jgi:hypothetical protein
MARYHTDRLSPFLWDSHLVLAYRSNPLFRIPYCRANHPQADAIGQKYFAVMDAVFQLLHLYLKSTILQTQKVPIFQAIRTQ